MTGIYGWTNQRGGVHFYRVGEPIRVAARHGIPAATGNILDDAVCERFDTILTHMLWDEHNSQAWRRLSDRGDHRLIFDVDDAMWEPDWKPFKAAYTPHTLERMYDNIRRAHVVTTPSPVIAEHIGKYNPNVWVCPNTVPETLLGQQMRNRPKPWISRHRAPYVVGYQGSPSHHHDWSLQVIGDFIRFLDVHGQWTLHFWGPDEVPGWPVDRVGHTPWMAEVPDYYRSLSMDVGVGPLKWSPFNQAKSGLRAVEYAALGVPAILPDIEPYTDPRTPDGIGRVEHGVTGLLLGPRDSWYDALRFLAEHHEERHAMGTAAKERAADWTTEANIGRWCTAWNSA